MSGYGSLRCCLEGTDEELMELRSAVTELSRYTTSLDDLKLLLLIALRIRQEREGTIEDAEEAIALGRGLIGERSAETEDVVWLIAGSELAYSLENLHSQVGDARYLDEAIELRYRINDAELTSSVFDNDEKFLSTTRLTNNLMLLPKPKCRQKEITEATTLLHRAVQLTGSNDVFREMDSRFLACHDVISHFTPETSMGDQSEAYADLAEAFVTRFKRFGERKDIDSCIDARRRAFETAGGDASNAGYLFLCLASSYKLRFDQYREAEDIRLAVKNFRQAVARCESTDEDYPAYLICLSAALADLQSTDFQPKYVDETVNVLQKALSSITPSSPHFNDVSGALCLAYINRFFHFGDIADLEAVYEILKQSQDARDELCSALVTVMEGLFYHQPDRHGAVEDVKNTIAYQRRQLDAMRAKGADQLTLGQTLFSLGSALDTQCRHLNDLANIDEPIQLLEEAAENLSNYRFFSGLCMGKLGALYNTRYSLTKRNEDFESSIQYHRMVIETFTENELLLNASNAELGGLLLKQYQETGRIDFRTDALPYLKFASNSERIPRDCVWRLTEVGKIEQESGDIESAFQTYKRAIELLPRVAWIGHPANSQLDKLSYRSASQYLASDAAAVSILLASQSPEQNQYYIDEALRLLDQGRSVMWSQISQLQVEVEDLRVAYPDLVKDLEYYAVSLRMGAFIKGRLLELQAKKMRSDAERFEKLVDDVRQLKGFGQFLLPLSITEIQKAASEGPIVVVNASQTRCDALVIESGKPLKAIALTGLTPDVATELTQQFVDHVTAFEDHRPKPMNSLMNRIWSLIGHPILEALGLLDHRQSPLPRVWWCLTGQLTFLPIHACFPEEPKKMMSRKKPRKPLAGMMDLVVSSYTPTISALVRAQSQQRKAASMDPRSSSANNILIVAQSEEVPDGIPLPNAKLEADAVREIVVAHGGTEPTVLMNADATKKTVRRQLETCSWAHFSCHAIQKPDAPMQSALLMSNGPLTLERLAKTSTSHSQFTYLSACQSAKGDKKLPNESVHVAAGMQYVGFPSVVGAMWSIRDDYGRIVAESFYESVYEGEEETVDVGRALHNAIQNLRKTRMDISVSQWAQFIHIGVGKVQRV